MHASRSRSGFERKRVIENIESSGGGEAGCASGNFNKGGRTLTPPRTCFLIISYDIVYMCLFFRELLGMRGYTLVFLTLTSYIHTNLATHSSCLPASTNSLPTLSARTIYTVKWTYCG